MEIKGIMAETALPVIIFDIGGYFAPYVDELSVLLGRRLILVLEDTANGHEKYRNTDYFGRSNRFKSVAYDSYKMAENVMVANVILSHLPSYVQGWSEYKAVLVVGYGRIGRSLCFGLKRQGFKRIVVVDSDRGRLFMAATEEFEVLTPLELKSCRDIFHYCFSMSGQHGTNKVVVNAMCENGYICVVTSYDDEFDSELIKIYESGDTSKVHVDGKKINIVNGGRPINLSVCAAFDARNLSLHFIFGRILSSFLVSLGMKSSGSWEEEAFFDILSEIR
ncbi:NAD-binding protein [Pseudomonas trivialis]|uniref:S-adenosyl-L-homocysteine hydrolase NAD binding domain-containing protein n=1 Tax=Pseudomonas trivialis TaxID=200450 RepID=A0A0H5AQ80_9PSED|nr:NAD-binding protein [Pseudomonas trivialis]AKS06412.1 hypothetical protein AA957_09890 [Pseudomonas trivialis]